MSKVHAQPAQKDNSSRNRWIAVAAALVAVLGVGLILITGDDEGAPLVASDSPEDIALSFLEAKESYDTAAALALVADEAIVAVGPATSKEGLAFEIAFQEATGLVATPVACEGTASQLNCTAEYTTSITRALGSDADTFTYDIAISEDQIVEIRLDLGNYSAENWEPFRAWISQNHSDDLGIMYDGTSDIAMSDESLALWRTRIDEYAEELSSGAGR